jgi:hypothetical protein
MVFFLGNEVPCFAEPDLAGRGKNRNECVMKVFGVFAGKTGRTNHRAGISLGQAACLALL